MIHALALLASLVPSQARELIETHQVTLDGAGVAALENLAVRMGATANQARNLTGISIVGDAINPGPPARRVFVASGIEVGRCLTSAQYDSLGDRRGDDLGIVGDGSAPPPVWFVASGCNSGEIVAEVGVDSKQLDAGDVIAAKALVVEIIRLAGVADTGPDKVRGMTCGRLMDQVGQPRVCAVAILASKTEAQHKAMLRLGQRPKFLRPSDPARVD